MGRHVAGRVLGLWRGHLSGLLLEGQVMSLSTAGRLKVSVFNALDCFLAVCVAGRLRTT
jgi:hypothetical protein